MSLFFFVRVLRTPHEYNKYERITNQPETWLITQIAILKQRNIFGLPSFLFLSSLWSNSAYAYYDIAKHVIVTIKS